MTTIINIDVMLARRKMSVTELAEQVGISGWEMRKRNVIHPGEVWGPGQIMDDGAAGAEECLDRAQSHIEAALAAGKPYPEYGRPGLECAGRGPGISVTSGFPLSRE